MALDELDSLICQINHHQLDESVVSPILLAPSVCLNSNTCNDFGLSALLPIRSYNASFRDYSSQFFQAPKEVSSLGPIKGGVQFTLLSVIKLNQKFINFYISQ